MSNPGMRLTRAGRNILADGLLGEEIHFTKVAFGDATFDYETENLSELTALKSWKLDLPIIGKSKTGDGTVTIVALCSNFELEKGFAAREVGVFARARDGSEVLYAYRNAGDEYNFIPAKTGVVVKNTRYAYKVEIGDAENVTFQVDLSFSYATQEEFEKHIASETPHPEIAKRLDESQELSRKSWQILRAQSEISFDANLLVIEDFDPATLVSGTDELKTEIQSAEVDLKKCAAMIRHSELIDAEMSARSLFIIPAKTRNITLGTGDGTNKIFPLTDQNIDSDTVTVRINGVESLNFYYDTAGNYIQTPAPSGSTVSAAYDYDGKIETVEMTKLFTRSEGSYFFTQFTGENPQTGYTSAALVLTFTAEQGTSTIAESGTGVTQAITLPHFATNINCSTDFSYDADDRLLEFVAPVGATVNISYDWQGKLPDVLHLAAAWGK